MPPAGSCRLLPHALRAQLCCAALMAPRRCPRESHGRALYAAMHVRGGCALHRLTASPLPEDLLANMAPSSAPLAWAALPELCPSVLGHRCASAALSANIASACCRMRRALRRVHSARAAPGG